ncbi:hypothetical protein Bealeia1_00190 [Candidatus Bealeia paramacronuclearis]|uniref:Sulfatase N-terminal domain-containing protein n=1 Tax=Candidatus Bealeia paramacronuclearis TaxID=1921001 RepID=A0ABZ2C2K2_9PROT
MIMPTIKKCEIISSVQRDTQELSFLHHLHCMNTFVEKIVSTLPKNDPNSIIIVQGDHSPSKWMVEESGESPKSKTEFKRIFSIFSAVYIDGLHPHSEIATYLSGTPTPINNFRIIFSYLSEIKPQFLEHRFFDFYFHELTDIYNSSYEVQHLKAL